MVWDFIGPKDKKITKGSTRPRECFVLPISLFSPTLSHSYVTFTVTHHFLFLSLPLSHKFESYHSRLSHGTPPSADLYVTPSLMYPNPSLSHPPPSLHYSSSPNQLPHFLSFSKSILLYQSKPTRPTKRTASKDSVPWRLQASGDQSSKLRATIGTPRRLGW